MTDAGPSLNKEQKEAVEHGLGPLLIIAGAGTGKTTVVTQRIKHLITNNLAQPSEILALTFTEKAACEMEERIDQAMPYGYSQMWICTFHSFCDRVLRNEALQIGLDPRYRLMTEAESIRFFKQLLFEFKLKYFCPLGNPAKFISGMIQHFSRLKDEDVLPSEYVKWVNRQSKSKSKIDIETDKDKEKFQELAGAYEKYEELKAKGGKMDFSDLISNTLKLFRSRPNVLKQYQKQFKYILVDEFQDTNIAQNDLVKMLTGDKQNLTVVADDDQSIYKWRGAAVSNVMQFRTSFPRLKVVSLTTNYRSTQTILDYSYKLIQNNNPDRLEVRENINKKLIAASQDKGSVPEFLHVAKVEDEAEIVVKKILKLVKTENRNFSDFAILVRANNHSDPFVRAFSRLAVPYQFLGPGQLFHKEEVKELIAYLKVLYNFEDSVAFYKVLTMDIFGISGRDLAATINYAKKFNSSLFEAAEKVVKGDVLVDTDTKRKISVIVEMIHKHLKLVSKESAGQIAYYFLQDSGILKSMINPQTESDAKKVSNIAKFFDKLKSYETDNDDASVFAVVDWIDLSMDLGESPLANDTDWDKENAVNILTIHSSKGLEFPVVFVVNLVSQRFPTIERREQIPIPEELIKEVLPVGDYHLQEERRLFYVAVTRAKERLFLTAADYYGEGKREKKISQFVVEMLGQEAVVKYDKEIEQETEQLSFLNFAPMVLEKTNAPQLNTPRPVTYLSYSQIDTFNFCPLHYKMRYISKIPTSTSAALSFGNTLHITLKEFNDSIRRGQIIGKKELLGIYDKSWIKEGYQNKSHEREMKRKGESYLNAYLESDLFDPKNPPLALEEPFTFSLGNSLKVGGKIDRVNKTAKGIEIIDYKTTDYSSKDLPTAKELAKDLQLSFYALAAQHVKFPFLSKPQGEIILSLYLFDKGVKLSTTRTTEDLEVATSEILKTKEEIEKSDFSCKGGFWCKNCEYKLFCEAHS
ncbi:MAG: hypothetical protein A3D24_02650 [Candidatus Blackburnbacteria bacterium RIFCSPHIGHO2_02_FULL_39_13]|nr:MAG: hypothetical protein A3D24_02650 [Candidatus Blackburnbacteria bacterium RIFCSPHIGHO2_02_FULL_39_13]